MLAKAKVACVGVPGEAPRDRPSGLPMHWAAERPVSGTDMTGRPGYRTIEMIGGSSCAVPRS